MTTQTRYRPSRSTIAITASVAATRKDDPNFVRWYLRYLVEIKTIHLSHAKRIWRGLFGNTPFDQRKVLQ